ncbi:MAG: hypothetical protein IIA64_11810 [Planctomycetes bacterium]|nr:hypothetical protein [Planctomycetota bacterium]
MQEASAVSTVVQYVAVLLALATLPLLIGCEAPPAQGGVTGQPQRTPIVAATPMESGPPETDPQVNEFVAQAQRDVQQIMSLSQRRTDEDTADATQSTEGRDVQWLTRSRTAPETATAAPEPAQGSLATAADISPPPPVSQPQTNQTTAIEPLPDDRLRQLLVELSREAYHHATYSDVPLRQLLVIVAQAIISPDRQLQVDAIPGLTDREREVLSAMQAFYTDVGERLLKAGDPEVLVTALAELKKELAKEPQLRLSHAALSSRVSGFGAYDEFKKNKAGRYVFLAHTRQQAVVYVEIEEFKSELNTNSEWVTELSQQLVIFSDRDGIPVWRQPWRPVVDVTKNRRHDFFVVQVITLPDKLSVGRYQFKISVRDERSGAEAEATLELDMVADPSLTTIGRLPR